MSREILFVDDDQEIRETFSLINETSDQKIEKIHMAADTHQATITLSNHPLACMVLDINLDGENSGEIIGFLKNLPAGALNKNIPIILISGFVSDDFIERNKEKFYAIMPKPLKTDHLHSTIMEIIKLRNEPEHDIPSVPVALPFPVEELDQKVNHVMKKMRQNKKLKEIFKKMKVNRNKSLYLPSHIGMIINITGALCAQLEWNSPQMVEKFIYAAYLHDASFFERPELAKIQTSVDLQLKEEELSEKLIELVKNHPKEIAKTARDDNNFPPDVDTIIEQHHERPNGNGFPAGIDHKRITPLSSLFIVSHDLTSYIMKTPKWEMKEFLDIYKPQYKGPNFHNILNALKEMKT